MTLKTKYPLACSKSGITLLELMVVVAIVAILSSVAIAGLSDLVPRYRVKSAARELRSELQSAKMEAVKRNQECLVEFTKAASGNPGSFMACFDDNNDDACDQTNDTVIAQLNFADYPNAELKSINDLSTNFFKFNSRGMPNNNGSVDITSQKDTNYSFSVAFSQTGRIQIN